MRAVGGGGCVGGCGEVIAGRYEGEFSNNYIHGQGAYTAAKAGWTFTGAFALFNRPTEGELSEADGRRFAVLYAADCASIFNYPTPSSKVRVGSVSPRARTSMVLERRRRASAALLVPACAGVCVCPATEHRPHLTTWPCRRPCSRRGAEAALRASDALRWAATGGPGTPVRQSCPAAGCQRATPPPAGHARRPETRQAPRARAARTCLRWPRCRCRCHVS